MPHSTDSTTPDVDLRHGDHPHNLSAASYTNLQALLTLKLSAVPPYHLPALTLSSILTQSPRTLHIPHTPPDIQLAFFLQNRAIIDTHGGRPIKDEEKQNINVTRAIWYYRVDERMQWVRFHDTARWNLAMFAALLAEQEEEQNMAHGNRKKRPAESVKTKSTGFSSSSLTPSARRFIQLYLAAVLEHHNTPSSSFTAREAFVEKWKKTRWDLYTALGGAQKKLMKNRIKALSKEWEAELDYVLDDMGKDGYERKIAKFVGCVIPGRRSKGGNVIVAAVRGGGGKMSDRAKESGAVGAYLAGGVGVVDAHSSSQYRVDMTDSTDTTSGNHLLDALRVPYTPTAKASKMQSQPRMPNCEDEGEAMMVTDVRHAIAAVLRMRPRDILPVLMRLFPEQG